MPQTIPNSSAARHRLLSENVTPTMAKAHLRKAEVESGDWRGEVGKAIERVKNMTGLSLKEFADAVGREDRQVARWIAGTERPQFDAIFAVEHFRQPLVIALAELIGSGRGSDHAYFHQEDGVTIHQVTILHPVAVYAQRSVLEGLGTFECEIDCATSVDEALALHDVLASLYQHVDRLERLAIRRADAILIGGSRDDV
jgi:transcriptional regulator with XRE-family HTH domain